MQSSVTTFLACREIFMGSTVSSPSIKLNPELSSRDRLVAVAKHLFSTSGYENTTTVAIAREARTSESQLVKHFGSKEGLLEAVFEDGWSRLRMQMANLQTISSPQKQLKALMHMVVQLFNEDRELRDLMLLEGRRIRREGKMIMITRSYTEFVALIDKLIERAEEGRPSEYPVQLMRSSLMNMFEGLLRDLVMHERFGYPAGYSVSQAEKFAGALVDRLFSS
jgi:AcrR family transcriptional regulator